MRLLVRAAILVLIGSMTAWAQQAEPKPSTALVSFSFDRPGLEVPKFTLQINEDGSGRYQAEQIFPVRGGDSQTQQIDRDLTVTPETTAKIFAAARDLDRFNDPCASNAKNIADTGKKTLHYSGDGGEGACTYNYSEDKRIAMLTEMFQAIAFTLDMGRKLAFDHRFDRLGLDAATASLVAQVDAGRAMEVGTIAPTLKSIAEDTEVLERVRLRAAKLLRQFPAAA